MSTQVKWERKDGILIATLAGRIDSSNADEIQRMLESGIDSQDHTLLLDFEQVSYISSAGLRVCLIMAKQFSKPVKQFAICTLSDQVSAVVKFSGFDRVIPVYDSRAAAINAFENS